MDAILEQCPGVIGIHDDMVIFGVDQEDHDANLINLLNVCQKEGIGTEQQETGTSKRESHILRGRIQRTRHAIQDPKKVQGITEMTAPTDKQQLQSFLGMVNYMGTFIPNLSHHTEPLRAMLKKDVFHWEDQQTRSFQQVKTLIAKANTTPLRYYDRDLPVTVQADASLKRAGSLSHTEARRKGPANRLCQQEPHGCGDEVCQHRTGTSSHCLCLPKV